MTNEERKIVNKIEQKTIEYYEKREEIIRKNLELKIMELELDVMMWRSISVVAVLITLLFIFIN